MTSTLRNLLTKHRHIIFPDVDLALAHDDIAFLKPATLDFFRSVLRDRLAAAQLEVENLTAAPNSL